MEKNFEKYKFNQFIDNFFQKLKTQNKQVALILLQLSKKNMKLLERFECPFCKKDKFKSIYKKNYSSKELSNFIQNYYKSEELNEILKHYYYDLSECLSCRGIFQKFIPNNELSHFLYNEVISTNESYNKKINYIKNNEKKLNQDLQMISNLFDNKLDKIKILEFDAWLGFLVKIYEVKIIRYYYMRIF